jgi:hypothetical protein
MVMKRLLTPYLQNYNREQYFSEDNMMKKKRLNEHTGHVNSSGCPQIRKYIY